MSPSKQDGADGFSGDDASSRRYTGPRSGRHPIPTISGYRRQRHELADQMHETEEAQKGPEDESRAKRAVKSAQAVLKGEDDSQRRYEPYPSANRNHARRPEYNEAHGSENSDDQEDEDDDAEQDSDEHKHHRLGHRDSHRGGKEEKTATEAAASTLDPKKKRKAMKKTKRRGGGREVTDPVTHLPITVHDHTKKDLDYAPENSPEPGTEHSTSTGVKGALKTSDELEDERAQVQDGYEDSLRLFPPPEYDRIKTELAAVQARALYVGLGALCLAFSAAVLLMHHFGPSTNARLFVGFALALCLALALATVTGVGYWTGRKADEIFEDEIWSAARRHEQSRVTAKGELPESVQWLNSFFSAVWPLINPDLFASLGDTIEDVMQASLPKAIKMVSVDDMGQGAESLRFLGVRWLPTGAANQSVSADGKLQRVDRKKGQTSDRTDPENGTQDDGGQNGGADDKKMSGRDNSQQEQEESAMREGMEAEEGDFVNLELAFAYRGRSSGKGIRSKRHNAHMYLKFYLYGGLAVPIWVELRGIIGTARLRLQLTPDPPFVSLCTLTFLGQPRASISCVPLSKHSPNIMDLPLISSFVQSSIDAALAEYTAPKSLTLNLKDMLVGDDFKKNTNSIGVILVVIKQARGFKQGDGNLNPLAKGSSDPYVTVSWGKFGKPVSSTRIIVNDMEPSWDETASVLVTPEELNAGEKLRLQLWDSDKWTADDDLGRVEISLKELMNGRETLNRMQDREDRFTGQDPDEQLPGRLVWSVGYFAKTDITDQQLQQQTVNERIRTTKQLEEFVSEAAQRKLRESGKSPDDDEIQQQTAQDYRDVEDSMIISAPPNAEHSSGILGIQIHNITGLALEHQNKKGKSGTEDAQDDADLEQVNDMPDSYCTIVLNHRKIYRTRTKPKNGKPFFNAGTERFVRDWRDCEVVVAVRDSREREDDPLIGIVYLPLSRLFAERSQVVDSFPLVGGIGYGRVRISLVWRSVTLQLPKQLAGWDYGTIEVKGSIKAKDGCNLGSLQETRLKVRTNTGRAKLYAIEDGAENKAAWQAKRKSSHKKRGEAPDSIFLAVRKRYSSAMVVEFRESKLGPDSTPAFAVLWLNELVDDEDQTVTLKVWKGGSDNLRKAESCCPYQGGSSAGGGEEDDGETEQPLGEIEMTLHFWHGLSGYHKKYAAKSKSTDMRDVMECLDTITDEGLESSDNDSDADGTDDSSSSDSSDTGDEGHTASLESKRRNKKLQVHTNDDDSLSNTSDDEGGSSSRPTDPKKLKKGVTEILRNPVEGVTKTATDVLGTGAKKQSDDAAPGARGEMRDYADHYRQLHRQHRGVMQWRAARELNHLGGKMGHLKGKATRFFSHQERQPGVETEV